MKRHNAFLIIENHLSSTRTLRCVAHAGFPRQLQKYNVFACAIDETWTKNKNDIFSISILFVVFGFRLVTECIKSEIKRAYEIRFQRSLGKLHFLLK